MVKFVPNCKYLSRSFAFGGEERWIEERGIERGGGREMEEMWEEVRRMFGCNETYLESVTKRASSESKASPLLLYNSRELSTDLLDIFVHPDVRRHEQ